MPVKKIHWDSLAIFLINCAGCLQINTPCEIWWCHHSVGFVAGMARVKMASDNTLINLVSKLADVFLIWLGEKGSDTEFEGVMTRLFRHLKRFPICRFHLMPQIPTEEVLFYFSYFETEICSSA